MKVVEGYVYHVKNEYFELVNDDKLMTNHEGNGTRPNYFCIRKEGIKILWFIPTSSKVDKYQKIIEHKIKLRKMENAIL